jgi:hypothetical protein
MRLRAILASLLTAALFLLGGMFAEGAAAATASRMCTAHFSNDASSTIDFDFYVDGSGYTRVRLNTAIAGVIGDGVHNSIDYEMYLASDNGIAWGTGIVTKYGTRSSGTVNVPSSANQRRRDNPYTVVRAGLNGDGYPMCLMRYDHGY